MKRRPAAWLALALAPLPGCLSGSPFEARPLANAHGVTPPGPLTPGRIIDGAPTPTAASVEAGRRVDTVGRKLVAANPALGFQPQFQTIGAPTPEIFHRGTTDVFLTEGLVTLCPTDDELAGVLATELGRMAAQRHSNGRSADAPPPAPPVGADVANAGGQMPDMTRAAELAKFEKAHPRRTPGKPSEPPDAHKLAGDYLAAAGYPADALKRAGPAVEKAGRSAAFQRQIVGQVIRKPAVEPH